MSLRLKLFLLLAAVSSAAVFSSMAAFRGVQARALRASEQEKTTVLVESVRAMAREAQLAKDPLMLIDYLNYLDRDRAEVVGTRIRWDGNWRGSPIAGEATSDEETTLVDVPAAGGAPAVSVELRLSRAVLRARLAQSEAALTRDLTRYAAAGALMALLVSAPLAWTFTSRIVALRGAMREIGEGRLDLRLEERGGDEIAGLAKGVNAMTARLGELDEMKKRFVSSVTHELRAPLFAIESYARMLLAGTTLSEEDRKRLVRVEENAARLARFVTSLLDAAKIERGRLEYAPRAIELDKLVEDVVAFYAAHAAEQERLVSVRIEAGPHATRADGDLLNQALTNLLTNAIKHAPKHSTVVVGLRRVDGAHELSVRDDGPGIDPREQERLFRPFERASTSRGLPGTGLGLSIVRAIAEKHGGRAWLESAPGQGSRFLITVPFSR